MKIKFQMSGVVKFAFISYFLESIDEVHHSTTRVQLRDNYIGLCEYFVVVAIFQTLPPVTGAQLIQVQQEKAT